MVIERGSSNTLAVMARETLSPSYWLLHFDDPERNGNAYCVVQAGNATSAMVTLTFTEVASGAVAADGEVTLSPAGNWNVTVYEQTSPTNIDTDLADRMVREMSVFVEQGAAADSGWTEQCPDQYPGCEEVTVRINTVDVPVTLQNCEIDIDCTDVGNAAYVVVQGDASHSHGGLFIPTGTTINDKPDYAKVDDPQRIIYYDGTQWVLEYQGNNDPHAHYAALGDEDYPWEADWSADDEVDVVQAQMSQICNGIATPTKGTFVVGVPNQRSVNSYINPPQRLGFVGHEEWDAISIGATHMVGILNGRLYVAGDNSNGATGQGTTDNKYTALRRIGNQNDWTHCAAGANCSYAIRAGRLYVTGLNSNGQLGNGNTTTLTVFTQVGSDTDWQDVKASHASWAAAIKNNKLFTCGSNSLYQTGLNTNSGNTTTWTEALNGPFSSIDAGANHGLAVKETDNTLWSWGWNNSGRTGQGTTSGSTQVPTQVGIDTDWLKCAAGGNHSLCIKQDETIYAFGSNIGGKLGPNASSIEAAPIRSADGQDWTDISLSPSTNASATLASYAMRGGNTVWACGSDSYGEVMRTGDATNSDWAQVGTADNHTLIAAGPGCLITGRT
jgi:alpha-tubulin suppressor-like RCC1 family protein